MRTFEHPNTSDDWVCPICGKNDDKPVVLIAIAGTKREDLVEGEQFHLECIELFYYKEKHFIAMAF